MMATLNEQGSSDLGERHDRRRRPVNRGRDVGCLVCSAWGCALRGAMFYSIEPTTASLNSAKRKARRSAASVNARRRSREDHDRHSRLLAGRAAAAPARHG